MAIEPLRRDETNIINSAAEGLELVTAIDDPNFQLMVDFYHLGPEDRFRTGRDVCLEGRRSVKPDTKPAEKSSTR